MDVVEESTVPVEVLPGIWRVGATMSSSPYRIATNAYLVVGEGESLMVDTAWWTGVESAHIDALVRVAQDHRAPITAVFITHAHRDHSGFVDHVIAEHPDGIAVHLHRDEQPTVDAMQNFQGLPDRAAAVAWYRGFGFSHEKAAMIVDTKLPDHPMRVPDVHWHDDDDVIDVGGRRLTVIATPGHTPGHAGLLEEATGAFFCGDALLPRGYGNPHVTVRAFTPPDPLSMYVKGLTALRDRDIRVCLPGHGPAVDDPTALIDAHLNYVETKIAPVHEALGDRPMTAVEIAEEIPWRSGRKRFSELVNDEWFLAFGDTMARIRRTVALGLAEEEQREDGVLTFRAISRDRSLPTTQ